MGVYDEFIYLSDVLAALQDHYLVILKFAHRVLSEVYGHQLFAFYDRLFKHLHILD